MIRGTMTATLSRTFRLHCHISLRYVWLVENYPVWRYDVVAIIEATGVFESPVDNVKLSKAGYRTQPNNSLLLIIITSLAVAGFTPFYKPYTQLFLFRLQRRPFCLLPTSFTPRLLLPFAGWAVLKLSYLSCLSKQASLLQFSARYISSRTRSLRILKPLQATFHSS